MPASSPTSPTWELEGELAGRGLHAVCGVDEAGRGPLCGPVVCGAVLLDPEQLPEGLNDSKKLTAKRRDALYDLLHVHAHVGVAIISPVDIDRLNIRGATLYGMAQAVADLQSKCAVDGVLIDGRDIPPGISLHCEAVIKGDSRSLSIAAASIIAKVTRDRIMDQLHEAHPHYGWDRNRGYPTKEHMAALESHGVTPHHRRSFGPVRRLVEG
uniref:Ribonuclease HII n=1 Tax=Magnetococcus massalia (strain MO-1) TaxID=451514 RepID=A0A1S7LNY1_MAGMO|nr:Ribonuclease HII, degrades RNA of DNA-RNA hybrids [Candidatus Magnetococcus massalia]